MNEPSDVSALIEAIKLLHEPRLLDMPKLAHGDDDAQRQLLVIPKGMETVDLKPILDTYRDRPERRKGTSNLRDLNSFIEWVDRHSTTKVSVIFANPNEESPSLLAVIDYHEEGAARAWGVDQDDQFEGMPNWCQHRGAYPMKLSKAWRFWQEVDGKPIKQGDFASLLEDRVTDILTPPDEDSSDQNDSKLLDLVRQLGGTLAGPSRMLELSRGLSVNETSRVTNVLNLTTGEKQIVYESSLQGSDGAPIKVPSMFLIGIPVFESGALYRIPVRLRFRKVGQDVYWTLLRHRPEIYFEDAFNDAVAAVREKCGLPVFIGEPER